MAPTRKTKRSSNIKEKDASSSSSAPGVQKIKSSIRQTRRLLAKETLAADVRIDTERRLKSLEADLAQAERTRKERNLATKYHKIKFFERQKVCRKIKHTKKRLNAPDSPHDTLPVLHDALLSHRLDLNYILHYPKTKRYISLFPPGTAQAGDGKGTTETDRQREELRRWVRDAMEKGEMDAEPEERMEKGGIRSDGMDWEGKVGLQENKGKGVEQIKAKGTSRDAFFEASDDDEEAESHEG